MAVLWQRHYMNSLANSGLSDAEWMAASQASTARLAVNQPLGVNFRLSLFEIEKLPTFVNVAQKVLE